MTYDITHALSSLYPNSLWALAGDDYEGLRWDDAAVAKPSKQELVKEVARLQAEYDAKEYARKRKAAYPPIEQQLDMIYHEGIDAWKQQITEIKNQFPKA